MGCVAKSSKEFKSLAARNNVDSNLLEVIVHKYWLETGNETKFPTDVYIQAQLGNTQYQESSSIIRDFWKKEYSKSRTYNSLAAINEAEIEAIKYFPASAIMKHKDAKGKWILTVKQPVARTNDKDAFFATEDNMSAKNARTLDLGLKENQTYGIDKVRELFNLFNTDRTTKAFADRIFSVAEDLGLTFIFNESLPFGIVGRYSNNNTITLKKSFLEREAMTDKKAPIMLHEIIHALSLYALSDTSKNWKKPEALEQFKTEINSLYQDLKDNPILKGERGVVDVKEFVAELANPVFRDKIQNVDREIEASKAQEKKSFWQRIVDAFKSLFGITHPTDTYYQRSVNALNKALDAFDIDTYMRYNGIKNTLRQGYNAKEWEFGSMSDKEVKTQVNDYLDQHSAEVKGTTLTNIKPKYKGKLIYAQSGTGKSTIADNITVFDSDYILGEILGVSPETAGFFFKTLSAQQKKAFGEQYRQAIKDKVAKGYTVLTANESLLNDADVVVYNSSAEQTEERVNRDDRAINNRYHAINYHEDTLSKIKKLRNNDKENSKEYIALDGDHYLLDVLSSNSDIHALSSNSRSNRGKEKSNALLEGKKEQLIADFLNEFGININVLNNYDGKLPLFDALNRVINVRKPSDITDGVGYAIAFMMQGDPEMQRMIVKSHFGMEGDYSKRVPILNRTVKNLHPNEKSPVAKEILREIGKQIASELRNNFGTDIEKVETKNSIWTIIKNFFTKLGMKVAAWGKRDEVLNDEKFFVKDIIEALAREDFSRIKGPRIKEGSTELAQRVDVEQALKDNPYEDSIIRKLGENGIALAGSTSIALQGSLFRPSENPLHDIDFNAGDNSSKASLDALLPKIFPNGTIQFSHSITKKSGNDIISYITLSEPFTIKKTGYDTAEFYGKDGKYLGKREHYDLILEDGVQGKLLDFFVGPTQGSNHGFYHKTINGYDYLLSNSNAAMAAKILWARPKDMWDYKNFKKDNHQEVTADFIKSLTGSQLKEELGVIKQESADYSLINGIEEKPKHSGKAVPQEFTFADGTKVMAPFKPNEQQVEALNAMDSFTKSSDNTMTLSGYAGTGKTSLMEMLAKKMKKTYKPIYFCATTNRAAAVLKDRVSKAGFEAVTLNKAFGINVEVDANSDSYDAKNLVNNLKSIDDIEISRGSTVIIDEASMINEENYNILRDRAKRLHLKIIFVGDEAQFSPVGETKISKVFRNTDGKVIRLTQVERTADNAILKEATDIRNNKPLSGETSFNSRGEGVAYVAPEHQQVIDEIIQKYAPKLKENPNYFRILAYTNKAVADYNQQVRKTLGYDTPYPRVGEPMMGYANWGYDWRTKSYKFINSEAYTVTKVSSPRKVTFPLLDGTPVTLEKTNITLEDSLGNRHSFDYIDIKNNEQNRAAATKLAEEKSRLWVEVKRIKGKAAKPYYEKINAIEELLFVNDNIKRGKYTLQSKVVDFGYAMTTHKSQGSTFTHVLLDDVDIARDTKGKNNNISDVDLEGKSFDYDNSKVVNTEDVDLGDLSNVSTPDTDTISKRQQIEYVGVSRATDTVTIISNNIKKEGSPLHHEKNVKEEVVKNDINSVEGTKNDVQRFNDTEQSQAVIDSDKTILSNEELKYWNEQGVGEMPRIITASEHTDPAFHVAEILRVLEGKKSISTWEGKSLSGKDFAGLYLITKHDGLPMRKLLETKIPKLIHFSITGLGGTAYEPGVMKYNDLLDRIQEYLKMGLDPNSVTIRIDPIVPGVTKFSDIENIVKRASEMGIKRIRFSILDAYPNTIAALEKLGYDFETYFGRRASDGKYNFYPKREHQDKIADFMLSLKEKYGVTLGTCAEPLVRNGINKEGCLSVSAVNNMLGTNIVDKGTDNNKSRTLCSCYGGKVDVLKYGANCASHCVYCYARHENDKALEYYNEDGTLKDNVFTRTQYDNTINNNNQRSDDNESNNTRNAETSAREQQASNGGLLADAQSRIKRGSRDGGEAQKQGVLSQEDIDRRNQEDRETLEKFAKELTYDTTQQVPLPGYEYVRGLQESISVDAAWKIPILKELDAKIDTLNSYEESKVYAKQIEEVLEATSEAEYKAHNKEKSKTDKIIAEYEKFNAHLNALLDNDLGLKASEVRHAAQQVADAISDTVTMLQQNADLAAKWFPSLNTKLDFSTASREQIITTIGIEDLLQKVREDIANGDYEDFEIMAQANLLVENWDALISFASDALCFNEGVGISKDFTTGRWTLNKSSKIDIDNFQDYSNDTDVAEENGERDGQEHWQVESRTVDVLNSMSALVKQGLHECYVLDADGNKVMSKWGIAERVNPRTATNSILRWVQGSTNLEEMVSKLSDRKASNPWIKQLTDRLSDQSGNETDFQSGFYSVFTKDYQLYSAVILEDGKYHSIPLNRNPALTEAMQSLSALFSIKALKLFNGSMIDGKLLGNANTVSPTANANLYKSYTSLQLISDSLKHGKELDAESMAEATKSIMEAADILGYTVDESTMTEVVTPSNIHQMAEGLKNIVSNLSTVHQSQLRGENKNYDPFKFKAENGIDGYVRKFLSPITSVMEDLQTNSFYDSGKMYQNYITPSFLSRTIKMFHEKDRTKFDKFMMERYGNSTWYREKHRGRGIWRTDWMKQLADGNDKGRMLLDHKVELNFNKHNYMRTMSPFEYSVSLVAEYCSDANFFKGGSLTPAWFRVPMQSNKPSSDFLKFNAYTGDDYKDTIAGNLCKVFRQELDRIITVRERNFNKNDAEFIKNFDSNGRKFCFLPVLNNYLEKAESNKLKRDVLKEKDGSISKENEEFAELLQKKVEASEKLTTEEDLRLDALAEKILKQYNEDRVQAIMDSWKKEGLVKALTKIKGIKDEAHALKVLENYLWNDSYASKMILQLTIGDIAFYKDAEDLQKRLAQLHAPGVRGRKEAIDYKGNRVSDGNYRTVILKDWDNFISNVVANINEVFERKIAAAPKSQKESLRALKDSLTRPRVVDPKTGKVLDKGGEYWNINVADAQGFSSPSSYRKKAFIFSKWSKDSEKIYEQLMAGEVNMSDLQTAFQPLKPFVYGLNLKNMGVEGAPINAMPAPFQAKNSEYLLIMADALLKNQELSRPNLLRAIYRVMEESEAKNPTKGIDTIQFESSIKSDLQGALDIHQFADNPNGEEAAYTYMMDHIYKQGTNQYDTDVFVKEMSFDNYCLQQEVPEHFKLHSQAHGSQIRMITPADLDFYTTDAQGNQVTNYYEWTEPDGTKRRVDAKEFKREYEQTIADSIQSDLDGLAAELHLNSEDKKERNIALSKILQKEISSSPRYGIDLLQACAVDPDTGEFRIPKGDPIQAKRIEQLINSIIKNRINKQKIAGGPIVQVSNFGTSKQLHIRFNDKKGNLIPLKEEYDPAKHNGQSYEDFLKENQGGIAYFEVYAPMWDNDLFAKFADENGNIDIEAIEATNPELLKMVSYRIPTEDKYSCAPIKIVGFMPKEAGDAIMLPYELTSIDDSDFDIDKRYVMRKDLGPILTKSRKEIETKLLAKVEESYAKSHKDILVNGKVPYKAMTSLREQVKMFLDNPQKMKNADALIQTLAKEYRKIAYYVEPPVSGNTYRNNKIVDMTYAVLTNEMTADKILNPGGFTEPKKAGYAIAAYKNPTVREKYSWDALQKMDVDKLKELSYVDKDLTFADTQVQFYKQNAAAGSLIGIFAVHKVAHATLDGDGIYISVDDFCNNASFEIAGMPFEGLMLVDPGKDREGNLIGKTLGSLVSASADAVKDPILNLMNINGTTANILNTLIRLGMPFNDAALFLSQDVLVRAIKEFNIASFDGYASLDSIIAKKIKALNDKYHFTADDKISQNELTKEELIEGLTEVEEKPTEEAVDAEETPQSKEAEATTTETETKEEETTEEPSQREIIEYKTLLAFQRLSALAEGMRQPTFVTRFNSISSAVGPLIIDNLITENKVMQFVSKGKENTTGFYKKGDGYNDIVDISTILDDHPILKGFAQTLSKAKSIFMDMPAGSKGFRSLIKALPTSMKSIMYGDKKLLSQFSDFYQSYLLMQSGYVNSDKLKYYVEEFPKEFFKDKVKENHKDNALINAIKLTTKKSGYSYLTIDITGMDEAQKENLRSAWIDLHKEDPELSKKLFDYSYFLAGVGFSPKTFMSLVPSYVKERLKNEVTGATYIDTYRNFPEIKNNKRVIDQFVANNWNNNKLAPKKGDKDSLFTIDLQKGTLIVTAQKDMDEVAAVPYMKVRAKDGNTYLWKLKDANQAQYVYEIMKPLGGNGEYLEISTSDITSPLTETTHTEEDIKEAEMAETPTDDTGKEAKEPASPTEEAKKSDTLVDLVMKQNPKFNKTEAKNTVENILKNPNPYKKYLQNLFLKQKGLDLSIEEALQELKKYC